MEFIAWVKLRHSVAASKRSEGPGSGCFLVAAVSQVHIFLDLNLLFLLLLEEVNSSDTGSIKDRSKTRYLLFLLLLSFLFLFLDYLCVEEVTRTRE